MATTTNRQLLYTSVAPFTQRQEAWEQALKAAEQHIKLGQTLQGQGIEILKGKHDSSNAEAAAKLIQQATATIEKGVKLEREARDKLIELYQQQPKDKG